MTATWLSLMEWLWSGFQATPLRGGADNVCDRAGSVSDGSSLCPSLTLPAQNKRLFAPEAWNR